MLKFVFYVCIYVMYNVYFPISSFLFYLLWRMYTIFNVLLFFVKQKRRDREIHIIHTSLTHIKHKF
jgi:hypothetical protein